MFITCEKNYIWWTDPFERGVDYWNPLKIELRDKYQASIVQLNLKSMCCHDYKAQVQLYSHIFT